MTLLRAILMTTALFLAAGSGLAQDTSQTGSGGVAGSYSDIKEQFDRQWNGQAGQLIKGAIGFAGLALALGAANDALSFDASINPDGAAVNSGGSAGSSGTGTSTSTSTSTSTTTSSTSTN